MIEKLILNLVKFMSNRAHRILLFISTIKKARLNNFVQYDIENEWHTSLVKISSRIYQLFWKVLILFGSLRSL